jgi:hypothetical protein
MRPMAFSAQSGAFKFNGFDVRTIMCWTSRQVNEGLASKAKATMAAAMGALAEVPVCLVVQPWCKSVVTICFSDVVPELYRQS